MGECLFGVHLFRCAVARRLEKEAAIRGGFKDDGVVHMRETALIGTSLYLVSARSAFEGL